jgi:DNA gyrase subunit B
MYTMRGVPGEAYTMSSNDVYTKNETFKNLTRAINAGIGDNFDVSKCRFDKVIMCSDGDVDGFYIFSLLGGFFLKHMPDLIYDGRLYLSVPPLYKIKDKKTPFVTDKEQYQNVYFRNILDKYILQEDGGKELTKREMLEFLQLNQYYLDELNRCKDHYSANSTLIEYVIKYKNDKNFKKNMAKKFPEIKIEFDKDNKTDMIVEGIYEGAYQIFTVDRLFDKKTEKLKELMDKNNSQYYKVVEKYKDEREFRGKLSIGEFLQLTVKLQPGIDLRYKGLGELSSVDMWETVMNPEKRTLIQLTVSDLMETYKMYDKLLGKGKSNMESRRKLVEELKPSRDIFDN